MMPVYKIHPIPSPSIAKLKASKYSFYRFVQKKVFNHEIVLQRFQADHTDIGHSISAQVGNTKRAHQWRTPMIIQPGGIPNLDYINVTPKAKCLKHKFSLQFCITITLP